MPQPPSPAAVSPDWRRIAVAAYGPTALSSIGFGAVMPLVALSALAMGASIGVAALVSGLLGIGQLIGDLPAGLVADRLGEKRAIILACLLDAVALTAAFLSTSLLGLAAAVLVCGLAGSVFGLARQTYLTEAVDLKYRARALSTLGGTFRIGYVIGPLAGAAIVAARGLPSAYAFAAGMSLLAAVVTFALPDLPSSAGSARAQRGPSLTGVVRDHRRVLLTVGVGALGIQLIRSARQTILPLWCEANGLTAAQTSLTYAISMGFDVALFFLGGSLMDKYGRVWVTVPAMLIMGAGLGLLPLAQVPITIVGVAALLGLGNGISSGVVMTLGSDASPALGRTKFLAAWRLVGDTGSSLGPLVITAVTLVAPLWTASLVLTGIAWVSAAWLKRVVPRRVST